MKKIRQTMNGKFVKTGLLILVLVFALLVARLVWVTQKTPGLHEVLSHRPIERSFDPSLFLAGVLSFSFAALSVAKGYEIFQRSRTVSVLPREEDAPSMLSLKDQEIDDLKKGIEWLEGQKEEGREKERQLCLKLEELGRVEQALRKSNIALSNECERLKSEAAKKARSRKPKQKKKRAKK